MANAKNNAPKKITLTIDRLGRQGDGLALVDQQPVSFPLTAPGDRIEAALIRQGKQSIAKDIRLIEKGSTRQEPPCPHFGTAEKPGCGGCQLQHISPPTYNEWKRQRLIQALQAQKIDPSCVEELVTTGTHNRQRATFAAQRVHKNSCIIGFYKRNSRTVIPVNACHVINRELQALLEPLSKLADGLLQKEGDGMRLAVTAFDGQKDIGLILPTAPALDRHEFLNEWCKAHHVTRLYWQEEEEAIPHTLYESGAIIKSCGAIPVALPAAGFLQPSHEGEKALIETVQRYAAPYAQAKHVADLFCGVGTFSFPALDMFPQMNRLLCADSAAEAVKALTQAAQTQGIASIHPVTRNLFTDPLNAKELKKLDLVMLDPPRAGAKEQSIELAASRVPVIIYISCHPESLARDLALLTQGGYTLQSVTPVDQFTWSYHLESVALLTR